MHRHPPPVVVHAISAADWEAGDDPLRPASLDEAGFVHLSTPEQIAWVADQRFAGRDDMRLLVVDPSRLPADLVWEDCDETGQDFPHLYAPLPRAAVVDVVPYRPGADGRYPVPRL